MARLVSGLEHAGLLAALAAWLHRMARAAPGLLAWGGGIGLALLCHLTNNLPAGWSGRSRRRRRICRGRWWTSRSAASWPAAHW